MKRNSALAILFSIIGLTVTFAAVEPRMPNISRITELLSAVPEYRPYLVPGTDQEISLSQIIGPASAIFIPQENVTYGSFYSGSGDIDTVEEYCLAAFFLKKKMATPELQKTFTEEFPPNAEGYFRMVALWYRIYAEDPNYNEAAKDAVPFIIKKAQKNGISMSEESARQYYEKAVRNGLNAAFEYELTRAGLKPDAVSLEKIIRPWYAYFISPTPDNYKVITVGWNCVDDISKKDIKRKGFAKAYSNAVLKCTDEKFHTQWTYRSERSYFYEEDIAEIDKKYFQNIPILGR